MLYSVIMSRENRHIIAFRFVKVVVLIVLLAVVGGGVWFFTNPHFRLRNAKTVNFDALPGEEAEYQYYAMKALSQHGFNTESLSPVEASVDSFEMDGADWRKTFKTASGWGGVHVEVTRGDQVMVYVRSLP